MKIPSPHFKDAHTGNEIFRFASLSLYLALLLHVILTSLARRLTLTGTGIIAVVLLTILLFVALARCVRPGSILYSRQRILVELAGSVIVITLFALQQTMPVLALPWLIGVAGVFPIVLEAGIALCAIGAVASVGFIINAGLGMQPDAWLPTVFAVIFVGLLSTLLSRVLGMNLAAIHRAHMNDRRFNAIARATRHVFMIADERFKVKYVNPALYDVLGYTPAELENGNQQPVVHPDDIEAHLKKLRFLRHKPNSKIFSRHRTQHKQGHWIWLETRGFNMLHDKAINGFVFSIEDISARKDAEHKLEQEHALLRAVLDFNPSMIYAKDAEGRFTVSNASFRRQFGYSSEEELRGKTAYEVFQLQAAEDAQFDAHAIADALHQQDMQVIANGTALENLEIQGFQKSDLRRWYRTSKYPLLDASGLTSGVLGITRDITESKEHEMQLEHQALHDPLTGLPNRRYLLNTLAGHIAEGNPYSTRLVMLFCDLDFFKNVNDTHGHDIGDKCLLEITRRIQTSASMHDFVARFGGDEFVILTRGTLAEASAAAAALLRSLSDPVVADDVTVKIQASIGIALLNANHKSPSELIRDADAAMYQAKERGRNRVEIFDASLQKSTTRHAQVDVALRFALERDELALVYQPKVSMLNGRVKGFEVLMRWNSPQYGSISPNEFIPIAETSGLVVPIGLWALEQACKQLSTWQSRYPKLEGLTIAVNVSMRQLLQSSFLADVTRILESTNVLPHSVELELTETSAMANPLQTIETLSMLKKLGLRLALDDFGTGYSSLAYLQKLPLDMLKIDKAFVLGLGKNQGDAEIVRLILALAKTLNLDTIAEGVESREHMIALKKLGCYLGQGYFFSPPISAKEAEELLQAPLQFLIA